MKKTNIYLAIVGFFFSLSSIDAIASEDYAVQLYKARDYDSAGDIWNTLASKGDPIAQFNMGLLFERGEGVGVNLNTAEHWYRKAAEAGVAEAQYNLAILIHKENQKEALVWLKIINYQSTNSILLKANNAFNKISKGLKDSQILDIQNIANSWVGSQKLTSPISLSSSLPLVGLTREQIITLQQKLIDFDLEVGSVDGVIGKLTREALIEWRYKHGLKADLLFVPMWLIE